MEVSSSVEEFSVQTGVCQGVVQCNGDTKMDPHTNRVRGGFSIDPSEDGWTGTRDEDEVKEFNLYQFPPIIPLSVGGVHFTTRLSTLTKYPDSMLAVMFSGRHRIDRDNQGNFFIDSNGTYFGYILDFLRHDTLPPREASLKVYNEARYFGLTVLQEKLNTTPEVGRMLVNEQHRRQFPSYFAFRQQVVQLAMKNAVCTKVGAVIVFAHRGECKHIHNNCVTETAHLKVGPWEANVDEETFVRTLHSDLIEMGFQVAPFTKKRCKWYVQGQTCPRSVFTLTFSFG